MSRSIRIELLASWRTPVPISLAQNMWRARTATSALVRAGACVVLAGVVACGPRGAASANAGDSTLARDLALANADAPPTQPQLKDTAASQPQIKEQQPAGPPMDVAPRAAAAAPQRASRAPHRAKATPPATAKATAPAVAGPVAAAPAPAPLPPLIAPSGTSFDIVLADTISTATAHVGDAITGTVAADIADGSGSVVIPAGTTVRGTVTTSSGPAHTPHLGISFSEVTLNGTSHGVQGTITALPIVQSRRTARAAQVGEVGGAAIVGALLGRAIGGKKSGGTAIGAVAGAAAGAAVADKTESHDAVLPKGARITVQLTAPLVVRQ